MVFIFWIAFYIVGVILSQLFIKLMNYKSFRKLILPYNNEDYDPDEAWMGSCMMSWGFLGLAIIIITIINIWELVNKFTDYIIKNLNL